MQIDKEGIEVLFACKCMTYDRSDTKFWHHGEYELLDYDNLQGKLDQHALHCPYEEPSDEFKTWTETLQTM